MRRPCSCSLCIYDWEFFWTERNIVQPASGPTLNPGRVIWLIWNGSFPAKEEGGYGYLPSPTVSWLNLGQNERVWGVREGCRAGLFGGGDVSGLFRCFGIQPASLPHRKRGLRVSGAVRRTRPPEKALSKTPPPPVPPRFCDYFSGFPFIGLPQMKPAPPISILYQYVIILRNRSGVPHLGRASPLKSSSIYLLPNRIKLKARVLNSTIYLSTLLLLLEQRITSPTQRALAPHPS